MAEYLTRSGVVVLLDAEDLATLPGRLSIGSHGYAQLTRIEAGRVVLFHRWLLGLTKGDGLIGDHINRNPLDCRRTNLRVVTPSGSSQNVTGRGASRFRNVYRMRDRWQAKIKFQGTVHHLGTYDTEEEAADVATNYRLRLMPMATD